MSKLSQAFRSFAEATARYSGKPAAFLLAAAIIVVWAVTGPMFGFNDTWQLVINTGTTIITFLMVFLIQNSQNRESVALQIKLDELIRATHARNALLDVDNLDEDALDRIRENYRKLAHNKEEEARQKREEARKKAEESRHARHPGRRARAAAESEDACEELKEIEKELARASADHADAGESRGARGKEASSSPVADRAADG